MKQADRRYEVGNKHDETEFSIFLAFSGKPSTERPTDGISITYFWAENDDDSFFSHSLSLLVTNHGWSFSYTWVQWNLVITNLDMSRKCDRIIDDAVMEVSIEKPRYNDNYYVVIVITMDLVLTEAYRNYEISLYIRY